MSSDYTYLNQYFLVTSLVIRGDKDERAVLCSSDKTYDLKIADTSNLLLVVPGCRTPDQLTDNQDSTHVVHTQVWKSQLKVTCSNQKADYSVTHTCIEAKTINEKFI